MNFNLLQDAGKHVWNRNWSVLVGELVARCHIATFVWIMPKLTKLRISNIFLNCAHARGFKAFFCAKLFRDYMLESVLKQIQVHFMVSRLQKCESDIFHQKARARFCSDFYEFEFCSLQYIIFSSHEKNQRFTTILR